VGGTAERIANSKTTKNLVSTQDTGIKGWAKRTTGRVLRRGGEGVAASNFDIRSAPILGSSKLVEKYGGKAQKGGYAQWMKDKEKKIEDEKEWVGKNTATRKEGKTRDAEQREVMKQNAVVQEHNKKSIDDDTNRIVSTLATLEKSLQANEKNLAEARQRGNPEDIARDTANYEKVKAEYETVSKQYEAFDTRQVLRHEVATGRRAGTDEELGEQELANKRAEIQTLDQGIKNGYGNTHEDVKKIDDEVKKLQQEQQTASGEDKKKLDKKILNAQQERASLVSLYEANRELYDMEDGWSMMGKEGQNEIKRATDQASRAKTQLEKHYTERARSIDKAYSDKMSAEGSQRVDNYLTNVGAEKNLGYIPTPKWKRDTAVRLRKPPRDKQLLTDLEKWFKEQQKKEGVAPTEEPEATPPTV
jgi:hypothetical protein